MYCREMFSSTFWRSRFSLEAKILMIRGSGRAFKTTGCAALLEDLFFRGGDLAGSLLSESIETVVVRAFLLCLRSQKPRWSRLCSSARGTALTR